MTRFITFYGLALVIVVLMACGSETTTSGLAPTADNSAAVVSAAPAIDNSGIIVPFPKGDVQAFDPPATTGNRVVIVPTPDRNAQASSSDGRYVIPPFYWGNATLKERIAVADVIAHVRVRSVQAGTAMYDPIAFSGTTTPESSRHFTPTLRFTFEVVEYLKSGSNTPISLTAMVGSLNTFDTS